jgi:hypothetical protein
MLTLEDVKAGIIETCGVIVYSNLQYSQEVQYGFGLDQTAMITLNFISFFVRFVFLMLTVMVLLVF